MEDIIEIYDPIYRQTTNVLLYITIVLSFALVTFLIVLLIKKIRAKKREITPEKQFKSILNDFLDLQKELDSLSSERFSTKSSFLFRKYISQLYFYDFLSSTSQELFNKLESLTNSDNLHIKRLYREILDPALYGKYEINITDKNSIIKELVDYITILYNEKQEKIDD